MTAGCSIRHMKRRAVLALVFLGAAVLLPSAGAEQSAPSTATVTRLSPPTDGHAYFGFTFPLFDSTEPVWGDNRPFDERIRDSIQNELAGKKPTYLNVWTPWQQPDLPGKPLVPFSAALGDIAKVRSVVGEGGTIYLDWNITQTTPVNDGITTRDVAAGKLDAYIRRYARAVREYGQPLLIRLFNGEYNGSWWYGVSPKADYRVTTSDFVKAWRRVVDIFRAVGTMNASWAWVVNAYPKEPGLAPGLDRDIDAYWPGDAYVDWAGADFYDVGPPSWLDGPYAFAVAHHKPFFVGEFAIRHEWSGVPPGKWQFWLEAALDYIESHPAIKAISYFNFNNRRAATRVTWDPSRDAYVYDGHVRYTPDVNDHDHRLLAGGPAVRALFASRIASPRYVSAIATEAVDSTPTIATATLLVPKVRRSVVFARWNGNLAAHTYDLQIKRRARPWRTIATGVSAKSKRVEGSSGERVQLRVRAHDVDGVAGPWSPARPLVFPK
jgi:hypothetical protein